MALFREWEEKWHAAGVLTAGTAEDEETGNTLIGEAFAIEAKMMALPAISAADLAAKLIVHTGYGAFVVELSDPVMVEALALTGSRGGPQIG